jgi:hypothetical protein
MATEEIEQEKTRDLKEQEIALLLQSPKKRSKKFIILALGRKSTRQFAKGIEKFLGTHYKQFGVTKVRNVDDLKRQVIRGVAMIIADSEFDNFENTLKTIAWMRSKRPRDTIPSLILSDDHQDVVLKYQQFIPGTGAIDDYANPELESLQQVLGKIRSGLDVKIQKTSSMYQVDHIVHIKLEGGGDTPKALLEDLSMHHGLLRCEEILGFRAGERLLLMIPIHGYFSADLGDFLNVYITIERVFIDGKSAYFSFKDLNARKRVLLSNLVLSIARRNAAA